MINSIRLFVLLSFGLMVCFAGCNKPAVDEPPAQNADASSPPRLLRGVHAEFPKKLWNKPGVVSVAAVVQPDGKVGDAKIVSSPHPELNPFALDAVKQWQFDPARRGGKPVSFTVVVNVTFQPPSANGSAATPQVSKK